MRAVRLVAVVLFGASLAGNAWLLNAMRERPVQDDDQPEDQTTTTPGPASIAAGGPPAARPRRCEQAMAVVEQQVALEEESLRLYLPPDQLFQRGMPNPAAERMLNPLFARLFGGGQHTLQCKEAACKLVVIESAAAGDEDWDRALSGTPEVAEWTSQASLARAVPIAHSPGEQPRVERTVYFKLNGPKAIAMAGER